jgi:hypothetical protein
MALPKFETSYEVATRLNFADSNRENDKVFRNDPNYRQRFSPATGLWNIADVSFLTPDHLKTPLPPEELPAGVSSYEQFCDQWRYEDRVQHYARVWMRRLGNPFKEC